MPSTMIAHPSPSRELRNDQPVVPSSLVRVPPRRGCGVSQGSCDADRAGAEYGPCACAGPPRIGERRGLAGRPKVSCGSSISGAGPFRCWSLICPTGAVIEIRSSRTTPTSSSGVPRAGAGSTEATWCRRPSIGARCLTREPRGQMKTSDFQVSHGAARQRVIG
jgi:hypothetical protein